MVATIQTSLVSQVVQALPRPVLGLLDAWSHRVAQRRARQRQLQWQQRQAAPAAQQEVKYHLRPWRD
jgi:hypothetical protein